MVAVQEFAQAWHRLVFDQDIPEVWRLMDEDFRRVVAQTALGPAHERGEAVDLVVEDLSVAEPQRSEVDEFFGVACRMLQEACVAPPGLVGPGQTVRFEAPALEVVRLYLLRDLAIDPSGARYLPDGQSARALTLIASVHESGALRMAGVGRVMAPGWPPTVLWEPPAEV